MADNITGSVVGRIRFNIDKRSWDNLALFQNKLTSIKRQMSGMDKAIKVQATINNINKVANATVNAEKKVAKVKEDVAKRQKKSDDDRMKEFDTRARFHVERKQGQFMNYAERFGLSSEQTAAGLAKIKEQAAQSRKMYTGANITDLEGFKKDLNMATNALLTHERALRANAITFASLRSELVQMTAAYTAFSAVQNIAMVGMDFEAMRASAKAFAKDEAGVADHMSFIREEAMRLGMDLRSATKEFTKFALATKTTLTKDQQRNLFTGVSEYATVLGVSKEDYQRAMRAVQQIAAKGVVYREELTSQLGDVLGGSVDAMMRAAGYTNLEDFFKAVEAGKVKSKDVLPKFAEEMKKMAREGGALDAVMQKTRANMGRFFNVLDEGKNKIFQGGMDESLSYMFGSLADLIQELTPLAEAFGAAFRGAVTTITAGIKIALMPFRGLVALFDSLGDNLERLGILDGSGGLWSLVGAGGVLFLMATRFSFLSKAIWSVNSALVAMAARFAPIIAAYAAIEDMALYATYGDKADTLTGRAVSLTKGSGALDSPSAMLKNLYKGYAQYSPLSWVIDIKVDDSQFGKAINATASPKNAVTQAETAQ